MGTIYSINLLSEADFFVYQIVELEVGANYMLEFYVRKDLWDGTGEGYYSVGGVKTNFEGTGEWKLVTHPFTATEAMVVEGAGGVEIGFGSSHTDYYGPSVDHFSLVKVDPPV
jgi:hypothetical protein